MTLVKITHCGDKRYFFALQPQSFRKRLHFVNRINDFQFFSQKKASGR